MVTQVFLSFFRVSHLFSVYMYQSVCLSVTPPFSVLVVCVKTTIMNNNIYAHIFCVQYCLNFFSISVPKNFSFIFYNQKSLIWS